MIVDGPAVVVSGRAIEVLADVLGGRYPGTSPLERVLKFAGVDPVDAEAAMEAFWDLAAARLTRRRVPGEVRAEPGGTGDGASSGGMVSSREAGSLLGVGPRQARKLASAGAIPAVSTRRGWLFKRADVLAYIDERED